MARTEAVELHASTQENLTLDEEISGLRTEFMEVLSALPEFQQVAIKAFWKPGDRACFVIDREKYSIKCEQDSYHVGLLNVFIIERDTLKGINREQLRITKDLDEGEYFISYWYTPHLQENNKAAITGGRKMLADLREASQKVFF